MCIPDPHRCYWLGRQELWIPLPIVAAGELSYDTKWRQRGGSFFMKLFGQESIGRPDIEIASNEKQVLEFLGKHLEENEIPPVNSILVSLHPKAVIGDVENAPVPIVETSGLRRHSGKLIGKRKRKFHPLCWKRSMAHLPLKRRKLLYLRAYIIL
jgi:hypothetical protein